MWLDTLDKRLGRYAVPHLTLVLVIGQVLFFMIGSGTAPTLDLMVLDASRVLKGEVWRLVTFLFIPPRASPLFMAFAWYFFYLMGTALENHWGTFRYNLFILLGWLATLAAAALAALLPEARLALPAGMTNVYLGGSVFLAFAFLYPEFEIYLFFVLPVKIKWLAWLTWASYGLSFLAASHWSERFAILAATANFLLFFGRDLFGTARYANRRMLVKTAAVREERKPRHVCRVCQVNNLDSPDLDFRYCTDCKPSQCYCPKHLDLHAHTKDYTA
jgi:hypothetical protein